MEVILFSPLFLQGTIPIGRRVVGREGGRQAEIVLLLLLLLMQLTYQPINIRNQASYQPTNQPTNQPTPTYKPIQRIQACLVMLFHYQPTKAPTN